MHILIVRYPNPKLALVKSDQCSKVTMALIRACFCWRSWSWPRLSSVRIAIDQWPHIYLPHCFCLLPHCHWPPSICSVSAPAFSAQNSQKSKQTKIKKEIEEEGKPSSICRSGLSVLLPSSSMSIGLPSRQCLAHCPVNVFPWLTPGGTWYWRSRCLWSSASQPFHHLPLAPVSPRTAGQRSTAGALPALDHHLPPEEIRSPKVQRKVTRLQRDIAFSNTPTLI